MIAQVDRKYLSYGLGRTIRRIISYGLYEGRPLTTRGQIINPLVFAWLRLLAALPGTPKVDRPIFIMGLGRSGTTILGILLSLHRSIGYLNEPKALWHVIDVRQDVNGNYSSTGAQFRLGAEDVCPDIKLRAHRLFGRYLALSGANRVVDKYPELIFRVPYVRKLFPDAKFVFITRNGRDVIASVVKWSERRGIESGSHTDDWWGRDDLKWNYLREQLILTDRTYQSVWPLATPDLNHADRSALEWIVTMREGLTQTQRFPEAVIRIGYEALLANPTEELAKLQRFCDLAPDPIVADYAMSRLYRSPTRSSLALHPEIDILLQDTMVRLGYLS